MPLAKSVPPCRPHRPSDRAAATLNNGQQNLGAHGSAERLDAYNRAMADGRRVAGAGPTTPIQQSRSPWSTALGDLCERSGHVRRC